jgi:hypothetical protein
MHSPRLLSLASAAALATAAFVAAPAAQAVTVFSSDFDLSVPAAVVPGTATLTGVQGFAGYGPTGNQFGGQFLRSATANKVTLTLTGLPTHDALSTSFLFAAIDSLDGTGSFPAGDYFRIDIDGTNRFRESFANAADYQTQSYVPPAGVELARKVDLGFGGPGGYYRDSAYNLGADPRFQQFAHTDSSVTIEFWMEGEGLQSLDDESWAMDNLRIDAFTASAPVPEPTTYALMLAGLGCLGVARRRRQPR